MCADIVRVARSGKRPIHSVAAHSVSTARVVVRISGVGVIIALASVALFRGVGSSVPKPADSRVAATDAPGGASKAQIATMPTKAADLATITNVVSAPTVSNTFQSDTGDGLRYLGKCSPEPATCVELPEVKQRLERLLGDMLADFKEKLIAPQAGVVEGNALMVSGCQPNTCDSTGAAFTLDLDTGATVAAVHEGNVMTIYGAAGKTFDALPNGLRSWIVKRQPEMDEMARYGTKPDRIAIRFW